MPDTFTPGSPGGKPPAGKDAQRRKMLIYGGLAAVMLLVVMMSRKSSASAASTDTSSGSSAVPDSGLDSSDDSGDDGSGAGGIDDSADLGNIDSDLQQLSQQIAAEQSSATSPGSSSSGADPNITALGSILAGFQTPSSTTATNTYRTTVMPGAGGGAAKTKNTRTTKPTSGRRDARGAALKGAKRVGPPRTRK